MKNIKNKLVIVATIACCVIGGSAFARGCPRPMPHPGTPHRSYCHPHHPTHHHGGNRDWWGKGGRNFWPGFITGLVNGMCR